MLVTLLILLLFLLQLFRHVDDNLTASVVCAESR